MADTHTDPWLALARDAYSESTTYFDSGIRSQVEADLRQFQGLHPVGSKYLSDMYRTRSRFFRPKTRAAVRKNEAIAAQALFSNANVLSLSAEDQSDIKQVHSAAVWNEVLNYRLTKTIPWFQTVLGAYQDAMTAGVVISYQCWRYDPRRKADRPCIDLMPIENARFSATSSWIDPVGTSPYFIQKIPMLVKDIIARMKTIDTKTNQPKWKRVDATTLLKAAQSYSDSVTLQRNHGRSDNNTVSSITDFTPVWVHRNFIELNGVDYVYYTLATEDILTTPTPVEEVYPLDGQRPFVVGNCVIETHKVYPPGIVRLSRDIQGELNENANQRLDNVKFAMNKRYFVKRGRQVDLRSLGRNVPGGSTLMEDPEGDVKIVETKDVTSSAYEEQDRLSQDFDETVGGFTVPAAGGSRKLSDTLGGAELLTEDGDELSAYQMKVFAETWAKPVLRQLLKLEMAYETDETIFTLAAKKAVSAQRLNDAIVVDDEMLQQELTINVDIGIGSTSPQKRLQNLIWGLKSIKEISEDGVIAQAGGDLKEMTDEIFTKLGYDGSDRFFPDKGEDPQVAALKQQLDEANAKLAKREDPELTKAKIAKLMAEADKIGVGKVKEGIEAIFGSMQAAEVIAAVPDVAPIADQLMRSAGYTPPTPPGVDPGFAPGEQGPNTIPVPVSPAAGLSVEPVTNKRTGVGFTPGGAAPDTAPGGPPGSAAQPANTNPLTPAKPASPFVGPNAGIETMREDTKGPAQ